jgi:ATP-dependent helicase/nuclease subunit A
MLAARIAQVVADGSVRVRDRDSGDARPARYGDVAILLRRTTYLHLYEEALERRGVPYHVVAGRGFYKQQEVLDVLHLLRVLDDPSDELHVAGVLRSPFFAVTDEGLFRLRRAGPDLFAALAQAGGLPDLDAEDRRGLARAAAALPAWVAAKDRLGLGALVDAVVFDSGYAASAVGRFGGQRAYANLRQMAELARQFERRGLVGLGEFVDYVTDFMQSEMRMEQAPTEAPGADTVRIMTIHKAKGLEFPVVALPDLGFESGNHAGRCMLSPLTGLAAALRDEEGGSSPSAALALARAAAADADAEEALRLLYVAMTRAEDYLLLTAYTNYNPAEDSWMGVLMEAIGANLDVGDRRLALPDGAALALAVHPPARDRTDRRARRVGPRNVFQAGRVAWDRLRERGGASVSAEAARALAQTSPPPAAHAPPLRITATALETYRHCPRRCWWSVVMGVDQPRPPDADDGRLSPLAWGSLCHRALELAEDDRPATLSLAAEGALREAPPLPPEARAGIRGELARTLADFWTGPLGRRVAAAGRVHREMPFVLALGRTEVRGTMDLLFCDAQGQWELVDYKSGSPSGPEADEQAARYELQLGLYALAAGRWIGSPISRWTVYFLGSGAAATRDVTPAALDAARTTAQDLLAAIGSLRYDSAAKGDCTRCAFETLCH